jgi:hypothetical protein
MAVACLSDPRLRTGRSALFGGWEAHRAAGGLFLHQIHGPDLLVDELPYVGGCARPALGME